MPDTNVNKLTVVLEGNSEKLQKALKAAENAMDKFDKKGQKLGGKNGKGGVMGWILANAKSLAPAMAGAFAVRAIAMFTKEAIILGSQLEGIKSAFELIENTGKTSMSVLKEATRGAVNEMTLMSLAVQAKNFQVPLENLGKFFEFATIRAAQTGESVEHLTRSIVLGIGRKSPLILDNLGITLVRLKEAMGKVGRESASVADISAAVAKIAKEEVEALTALGLAATTSAQKLSALAASFKNLKAETGEDFATSEGFSSVTGFFTQMLDKKLIDRQIKEMTQSLGMSDKEVGLIGFDMFKTLDYHHDINNSIELAGVLTKKLSDRFKLARINIQQIAGSVKDATRTTVEWRKAAIKGLDDEADRLLFPIGVYRKAILSLQAEEDAIRSATARKENKLADDRASFLDKYKNKLKEVEIQYKMSMITPLQKAEKENGIVSDAIVGMTMDLKNLGLTATKEFSDWNDLLKANGILIDANAKRLRDMNQFFESLDVSEAADMLSIEAMGMDDLDESGLSDLRDRISAFTDLNDINIDSIVGGSLLGDLEAIENALFRIQMSEIPIPDISKFQELKIELFNIGRRVEENTITQKEGDEARLNALNEYINRLIEMGDIVPEIVTKMKESMEGLVNDSILDRKKLEGISQMFSGIASSIGQVASQFNPQSGIAKFLKLAQAISTAAAAAAALDVLIKGGAGVAPAIAAAVAVAAALAGVVGSVGNISGGFGGTGGGYNSTSSGSQSLYTEISGRNLRIILDRDGRFSDRRG